MKARPYRLVHVGPRGRLAGSQRLLQAEAVVQAENRSLTHRACGAAGYRLVGVALQLNRATILDLRQKAAARRAGATGRSIILRPARHHIFRLDKVWHRLLDRRARAACECRAGESEPGCLEKAPSRPAEFDLLAWVLRELRLRGPCQIRGTFTF